MRSIVALISTVFFGCSLLVSQIGGAHESLAPKDRVPSALSYDRIEVLEHFLKVVYPDLAGELAMFNLESTFEGKRHLTIRKLEFYPCHPQRVEPSQRIFMLPSILSPNEGAPPSPRPAEPVKPTCGEGPTPEYEHFLDVFLDLGAGFRTRPIFKFAASGTYVDAKLEELRQQFAGKPYPTDDAVLLALLSKSPKYGPNNKKEFLAAVAFEDIHKVTGCRLRPDTATFELGLTDLQWHVYGTAPATQGLEPARCIASFEPFEGRLTLFLD
jgi:hypothetical protein